VALWLGQGALVVGGLIAAALVSPNGCASTLERALKREEFAMHSRVNTLQASPEAVDAVENVTRTVVLPRISQLPGFRGYIVLALRESA
jgi:hypothetical protein